MTNCGISTNPSVPAENAACQGPQNQWTQRAWMVGRFLTRTGRALRRQDLCYGDLPIVRDLQRMGMISQTRNGWFRITDAGAVAFPGNLCRPWREWPIVGIWIDRDAQRGRVCAALPAGVACDVRPDSWARLFTHTQRCDRAPQHAESLDSAQL
jgi:hypothetical protein